MSRQAIETRLRLSIKDALSVITKANSPNIYVFIHKKNGSIDVDSYNRVENRIIQRMIDTQLPIEAIIPQIENELDLM